jgi:hypothetical protein
MARTDSRVVIRNSEASGLVRSKACDSVQLTMATSNEGSGTSTFAVRAAARGVGHSCCLHGLERRVRNHQFSTSRRHQVNGASATPGRPHCAVESSTANLHRRHHGGVVSWPFLADGPPCYQGLSSDSKSGRHIKVVSPALQRRNQC